MKTVKRHHREILRRGVVERVMKAPLDFAKTKDGKWWKGDENNEWMEVDPKVICDAIGQHAYKDQSSAEAGGGELTCTRCGDHRKYFW